MAFYALYNHQRQNLTEKLSQALDMVYIERVQECQSFSNIQSRASIQFIDRGLQYDVDIMHMNDMCSISTQSKAALYLCKKVQILGKSFKEYTLFYFLLTVVCFNCFF